MLHASIILLVNLLEATHKFLVCALNSTQLHLAALVILVQLILERLHDEGFEAVDVMTYTRHIIIVLSLQLFDVTAQEGQVFRQDRRAGHSLVASSYTLLIGNDATLDGKTRLFVGGSLRLDAT